MIFLNTTGKTKRIKINMEKEEIKVPILFIQIFKNIISTHIYGIKNDLYFDKLKEFNM